MHSHGGRYVRHPPDKCAALKTCRAFFGVGTFPCKNITGDHFQPASQRTGAALSSRFLIPLLTMWGGGLWSDPLERPRGPRGRCGPTAPGTIPRESALGGPGHSAISRAASILVLFKLTHYPRVGCDSRGRLTLAKWGNRAQSVRGYLTLPIAFVRSSK